MADQSDVLPSYEMTLKPTIIIPCYQNVPNQISASDNTSSRSHDLNGPLPLRYTWGRFGASTFKIRSIHYISVILQLASIAIGACFLRNDFHAHPNRLAIFWLSLSGTAIVLGIWGYLKGWIIHFRDDFIEVTNEVNADREFSRALDSMVPWLSSAVCLGIAILLFKF